MADHAVSPKPLAGLTVLDFGHTIMGPAAGLVFADLGADVIKIEPPGGDPTRRLPGFAAGFFATFNRNKRSLVLDLKTDDGRAVLHGIARNADVLLENFAPGTMERLGCGWDDLRATNPRLVYLALKGYLRGPYENRGALDEVVQMQTGLAYMTGPPGRPLRAGASVIDILGGVFGVVAVLAALRERERTGRGQRVGSALFESAAFLMGSFMAGSAVTGQSMPPMPARKSAWGIYDVFDASDGQQVFVGVTADGQWQRFCQAVGRVDWAQDESLSSNAKRCDARDWLLPELKAIFAVRDVPAILSLCEQADIPHARIGRPEDLFADAQLLASGGLLETAISAMGGGERFGLPALPVEFGDQRSRAGLVRQPPAIGEHSQAVLEAAGYDGPAIAALASRGIVTLSE